MTPPNPSRAEKKDPTAYIGLRPCGCVVWVQIAGFETKRQEKAEIKKMLKGGTRVELSTVEAVRPKLQAQGVCEHNTRYDNLGPPEQEADRLIEDAYA